MSRPAPHLGHRVRSGTPVAVNMWSETVGDMCQGNTAGSSRSALAESPQETRSGSTGEEEAAAVRWLTTVVPNQRAARDGWARALECRGVVGARTKRSSVEIRGSPLQPGVCQARFDLCPEAPVRERPTSWSYEADVIIRLRILPPWLPRFREPLVSQQLF